MYIHLFYSHQRHFLVKRKGIYININIYVYIYIYIYIERERERERVKKNTRMDNFWRKKDKKSNKNVSVRDLLQLFT